MSKSKPATAPRTKLPFEVTHRAKMVLRFGASEARRIDHILSSHKDEIKPLYLDGNRRVYHIQVEEVVADYLKRPRKKNGPVA